MIARQLYLPVLGKHQLVYGRMPLPTAFPEFGMISSFRQRDLSKEGARLGAFFSLESVEPEADQINAASLLRAPSEEGGSEPSTESQAALGASVVRPQSRVRAYVVLFCGVCISIATLWMTGADEDEPDRVKPVFHVVEPSSSVSQSPISVAPSAHVLPDVVQQASEPSAQPAVEPTQAKAVMIEEERRPAVSPNRGSAHRGKARLRNVPKATNRGSPKREVLHEDNPIEDKEEGAVFKDAGERPVIGDSMARERLPAPEIQSEAWTTMIDHRRLVRPN
ncbi:hypothetical protein [Pandoraea apista]|uniref:hypothetical protein n=1 Tax=Pandoraea apista TaxID=93218 RepID=UPI000F67DF5A|nr:hypothetical protein [Pandoraea apista]RRW96107.1 hypothetical protein EGJ56_25465 [Pandoraea apista]RRW96605.1 hypothetical protein EGJ54_11360 [Pandoraea apista]